MADPQSFDELSSKELYDRAVARATRHADVRFFWRLLKVVPAAEAAAGEQREAENDVQHWTSQVAHLLSADEDGRLLEAMRPICLEYLVEHEH